MVFWGSRMPHSAVHVERNCIRNHPAACVHVVRSLLGNTNRRRHIDPQPAQRHHSGHVPLAARPALQRAASLPLGGAPLRGRALEREPNGLHTQIQHNRGRATRRVQRERAARAGQSSRAHDSSLLQRVRPHRLSPALSCHRRHLRPHHDATEASQRTTGLQEQATRYLHGHSRRSIVRFLLGPAPTHAVPSACAQDSYSGP